MITANETESIYTRIEKDAFLWLEQAEGSLMSADVIFRALAEVLPTSQTIPGIREKKLAYIHSYMLLTAIAFESVLKGLAVAQKKDWRLFRDEGGHGISNYAEKITKTKLSDTESKLLKRLQEYLVWVGRYVIPMRSSRYASAVQEKLRSFRVEDQTIAVALFERLKQELCDNA